MSYNNAGGSSNVVNLAEHKEQLELLKQEFKDLYEDLIATGKSEGDALTIVRHIEAQQDNYFESVKEDKPRLFFTIEWMEDHFEWSKMSNKKRTELLWKMGMNVKGGGRWYLRDERVRNEDGKDGNTARVQPIVYGQERVDDEWITLRHDDFSKVSSEEAQDWRRWKNGGSLKVKRKV
jgi:hypothetical protein